MGDPMSRIGFACCSSSRALMRFSSREKSNGRPSSGSLTVRSNANPGLRGLLRCFRNSKVIRGGEYTSETLNPSRLGGLLLALLLSTRLVGSDMSPTWPSCFKQHRGCPVVERGDVAHLNVSGFVGHLLLRLGLHIILGPRGFALGSRGFAGQLVRGDYQSSPDPDTGRRRQSAAGRSVASRLAAWLQVAVQHAWAAARCPDVFRAAISDCLIDAALIRLQPAAAVRRAHQGIHHSSTAVVRVCHAAAGLLM